MAKEVWPIPTPRGKNSIFQAKLYFFGEIENEKIYMHTSWHIFFHFFLPKYITRNSSTAPYLQ